MLYFFVRNIFASKNILAKDIEKQFDKDYKQCKAVFQKCSKLEDAALEYMIMCYTSASTIKANVVELLKIKDACTKLKTNQEAVVSTSKESKRHKRGKSSEVVTCAVYITEVETLNTVSYFTTYITTYSIFFFQVLQSSSLLGKGTTIVSQSTTIISQSVLSCSTSEITSINNNIAILTAVIVKVTTLVTQYQKV